MMTKRVAPPDQEQRDFILNELERCVMVEASAGTGKTTIMVGRMVNLLARGKCTANTLAAVTFTRKAASELQARFRLEVEKAASLAAGVEREHLLSALKHLDSCFIGTIHSFCARLLRERPIEAGVLPDFREIEDTEDRELCKAAWDQFVARSIAQDKSFLHELNGVGLNLSQLSEAFYTFALYPDIESWPADKVQASDFSSARAALLEYLCHIQAIAPSLPQNAGNDELIPKYKMLARKATLYWNEINSHLLSLIELLENFEKKAKIIQREWPGGKEQAVTEKERWDVFRDDVVAPALTHWRALRYEIVLRVLTEARRCFDSMRDARGVLNFQDLLMRTADLLRDKPNIRTYFSKRFTHLLVDEFQDTDPIQAQIMLYLTATDPEETNWQRCRPRPGALFVVGDPKQSIYRFRRADIVTYNKVKAIIEASGGKTASLTANFRTTGQIIDWVNTVFSAEFPAEVQDASPQYEKMSNGRIDANEGELTGLRMLRIPKELANTRDLIVECEADRVAHFIRHTLDKGKSLSRPISSDGSQPRTAAVPGDFMIITFGKKSLGVYGQKLQEYGIPHQVTGGSALNELSELRLLYLILSAVVYSDDSVRLVAALRSPLFGVSDKALYKFNLAGGKFFYFSKVPEALEETYRLAFIEIFDRMKRFRSFLTSFPLSVAIEKIVADTGLLAWGCRDQGADGQAGALLKAMELLRLAQQTTCTSHDVVDYLKQLLEKEVLHDGMPAQSHADSVVRIMNLHKSKGLEAPIVFLADPGGKHDFPPSVYIDRSQDKTRGYMAIAVKRSEFGPPELLAHPLDWRTHESEEKRFLDHEFTRLLYVAATRAGSGLVVSQAEVRANNNPWQLLTTQLGAASELENWQATLPAVAAKTQDGVSPVQGSFQGRWDLVLEPSYAVEAAKDAIVSPLPALHRPQNGKDGMGWGTVIHALLEKAFRYPDMDLRDVALRQLAEHKLSAEVLEGALDTVEAVKRSEIGCRARKSSHCLTEVPFVHMRDSSRADSEDLPTIIRGTIDLLFKEEDGWVIVDYKTDLVSEEDIEALADYYRPQVNAYAVALRDSGGLYIKESGLFFTRAQTYIV